MQSMTDGGSSPRSPRLSFLFSAILPGTGQLYNGSQRGYVYLAVEAMAWFARVSYKDAADRKEADFRAFADRHWDFDQWVGTREDPGCGWADGTDQQLLEYRESDLNQYYDELASGTEYRCGWDDAVASGNDVTSANWDDYRDQRNKASSFDSRAGLALGAIVLNRLVSAVDAFRIARGREVAGEAPSLRFTSELEGDLRSPMATFRLTKELP